MIELIEKVKIYRDSSLLRLKETGMPKGPQGQKRPADTIGAAVMVAQIATGEIDDNLKSGRVRSGKAGAKARANKLSAAKRSEIAQIAAEVRWKK